MANSSTIYGVSLHARENNLDQRGWLATVYNQRCSGLGPYPQWNVLQSAAGVLRGMHLHRQYDEYYVPITGRQFFVLKDVRRSSPTFGHEMSVWSDEVANAAITVPVGVAHGVYFEDGGSLFYGLSNLWTGDGEFECRWDAPEIESHWPVTRPLLSDKDEKAGTFSEMVEKFEADYR